MSVLDDRGAGILEGFLRDHLPRRTRPVVEVWSGAEWRVRFYGDETRYLVLAMGEELVVWRYSGSVSQWSPEGRCHVGSVARGRGGVLRLAKLLADNLPKKRPALKQDPRLFAIGSNPPPVDDPDWVPAVNSLGAVEHCEVHPTGHARRSDDKIMRIDRYRLRLDRPWGWRWHHKIPPRLGGAPGNRGQYVPFLETLAWTLLGPPPTGTAGLVVSDQCLPVCWAEPHEAHAEGTRWIGRPSRRDWATVPEVVEADAVEADDVTDRRESPVQGKRDEDRALAVLEARAAGESYRAIAKRLGISASSVHCIVRGIAYRNLDGFRDEILGPGWRIADADPSDPLPGGPDRSGAGGPPRDRPD